MTFHRLLLQIPPSPLRPHFVKAHVKVRQYADGGHAIFHGPRCIVRHDTIGKLSGELANQADQAEPSASRLARRVVQRRFARGGDEREVSAGKWSWRFTRKSSLA